MKFELISIAPFDKQFKRLSKKYPSLKKDLSELFNQMELNPFIGKNLGKGCYKIRLAISSKGKGKSGGARIITNVLITDNIVYFLAIYDKSEQTNISDLEIQQLLDLL